MSSCRKPGHNLSIDGECCFCTKAERDRLREAMVALLEWCEPVPMEEPDCIKMAKALVRPSAEVRPQQEECYCKPNAPNYLCVPCAIKAAEAKKASETKEGR